MNDDELAARLRAADPATHDAAPSSWLDDLVEDTMSTPDTTPGTTRRWLPLAAAAAVLVLGAGAAGFALNSGDDSADPPVAAPTVTDLTLPASDINQSCARVEVAFLQGADLAFDGTAVEVGDGVVTLDVSRWFKGEETDQVRLQAPEPGQLALIDAVEFVQGERYLVTASRGMVSSCGFSAAYSPELEDLFEQAFTP